MTELLTVQQAAKKLHVTNRTIYRWIDSGKIEPVRTPGGRLRIPDEQLVVPIPVSRDQRVHRPGQFPIVDISDEEPESLEPVGTKAKFWFQRRTQLFKEGRANTGENWAEKVSSELCGLLRVPHASYDLATWRDRKGVITPNFTAEGHSLMLGNVLLAERQPTYDKDKRFGQAQHTLDEVLSVVGHESVEAPVESQPFSDVRSAIDFFVGYLMLDAWIANQDRHHENWGIVVTEDSKKHLAPSFDHASSLGRNETDDSRHDRLTTRDKGRSMERYLKKASSALYRSPSDPKPMSTLDAFAEAARRDSRAAKSWLRRLEEVSPHDTQRILDRVPQEEITPTAVAFAQKMLEINRSRLLSLKEVL